MTGIEVPARVRVAAVFSWLLAPVGLLLVADGLWELRWWGTPSAVRLVAVLAEIEQKYGAEPPALLRGRTGAVELIVLGAAVVAWAALAPLVRKGRRWARTWGFVLGIATLVVGLAFIGADLSQPHDLKSYLDGLAQSTAADRIPEIRSLVYPGWYAWCEDIAQGLQVIAAAAAVAALAAAVLSNADFFTTKRAETAGPDEWDAAITRIHKRTVTRND